MNFSPTEEIYSDMVMKQHIVFQVCSLHHFKVRVDNFAFPCMNQAFFSSFIPSSLFLLKSKILDRQGWKKFLRVLCVCL